MSTSQVLPKELRLAAPSTMPQARSYMFKQQSSNATYDPANSSSIQINLPRLQRSYLTKDSYLKFRLNFTSAYAAGVNATENIQFDIPGAFGLIDKIEVYDYLGSTLLESTSGHGQLMALLLDLNANPNEMQFHYGVTSGTKGSAILDDPDSAATRSMVYPPLQGETPVAGGIAATQYFEYTIPLLSFLGNLSTKYAPLHNGYTIMISLNTIEKAFGATIAAGSASASTWPTSYQLSNVYYACQVLELGPTAESMLLGSAQGRPLVIPAKAFRNYVSSVPAAASNFRLDLNLNVASLTNILWIMREDTYGNGAALSQRYKTLSNRIRNYLSSWYFQYGSSILPQTSGIQCGSPVGTTITNGGHDECYIELLKSRHGLNKTSYHSCIDRASYNIDVGSATIAALSSLGVTRHGRFAAGMDLELVPGRSSNLICGMNTNGMNTSIYGTFNGTTVAARVDAWAEYDAFINISPGIATTVSF